MTSERYPGKSLALVLGKPLLHHIIERLWQSTSVSDIIVATSTMPEDEPICRLAIRLRVDLHRGHPLDVIERMDGALRRYTGIKPKVIRVMADQPFLDWTSIDEAVAIMEARNWDFLLPLSFNEDPVYGAGLSPWSWRTWSAISAHSRGEEREHAGMWLRRNLKQWEYGLRDLPHWTYRPYRLELDTEEDLALVNAICTAWDGWPEQPPPLRWVVSHLDRNPAFAELNASIREKTGTFTTYTRSEIENWERDYNGRDIVWSDAWNLVGAIRLKGNRESRFTCKKCNGPLVVMKRMKRTSVLKMHTCKKCNGPLVVMKRMKRTSVLKMQCIRCGSTRNYSPKKKQ
jgi:spore coat polysaccharide biosynthesis protein SpsF